MVKFKWGSIIFILTAVSLFSVQYLAADTNLSTSPLETFTGQLEILIADNFETNTSQRMYSVIVKQESGGYQTFSLSFGSDPPNHDLQSGDMVSVEGRFIGNTIAVDSIQREAGVNLPKIKAQADIYAEAPPPMEVRNAVVLIVSMTDAANSHTAETLAAELYTNPQSMDGLYRASSYQQLSFDPDTDGDGNPDIFGPFTITDNGRDDCDTNAWAAAADEAATNAGIDLSLYQHKVYSLPSDVACNWAGLGSIGCFGDRCRVWVKSSRGEYFAHELGHNLGWRHATTDPDNDGNVDVEYGDHSGIMGMPYWAQANAPHRDQKNWFDAFPGTLVSPTCSDTFRLEALELADVNDEPDGIRAIKIAKPDTNEFYYLSYRREIGTYPSTAEYANKVNVHRYNDRGGKTHHITNLGRGDRFEDMDNGITVTATAAGGSSAAVDIDLPNDSPAADFSYSRNHLEVQFNNSSSDTDDGVESYFWDFGDGNTSNEADPSHTYADGGTFAVELTVTDTCGETDSRTRNVQVAANNAPVADFSASANKLAVRFSDASTDSDGEIQSRQWDFGDGLSSNETNPNHVYAAPGTYQVTLTVIDDDGAQNTTAPKEVAVVGNVPPTAGFCFSTDFSFVQFTDLSTDSDGTVDAHLWDFGDSATSIEAAPGHTYATSGTYTVTLTVTDNDGDTHTVSQIVSVSAPIVPAAIPDFTFNTNGLSVQFTDNSSGSINSYLWDFGDSATSDEASPSHTYSQAGTFTVGLKVTNTAGSNTVTKEVTVSPDTVTPTAQSSGGGGGGGGGCFIANLN